VVQHILFLRRSACRLFFFVVRFLRAAFARSSDRYLREEKEGGVGGFKVFKLAVDWHEAVISPLLPRVTQRAAQIERKCEKLRLVPPQPQKHTEEVLHVTYPPLIEDETAADFNVPLRRIHIRLISAPTKGADQQSARADKALGTDSVLVAVKLSRGRHLWTCLGE